jgi:Protein of unknown function (DUF3102)
MATTEILNSDPVLAEHAQAIRRLYTRVVSDVAEIGRHLNAVKRLVGHGNWLPWLKREFGWSADTAERFVRVHEFVEGLSDSASVRNFVLTLPVSSVYLLAGLNTPQEARDAVIARAEAGEVLPVAEVKRVVENAKGRTRATIHRRMKLGDDVVDKLKGTSLDNAREMDELVRLNSGAAEGGHTGIVKQLVAAAASGKAVSAVVYTKSGAAFRRDDIGPDSSGEIARRDARIEELQNQNRLQQLKIAGLEREIQEAKATAVPAGEADEVSVTKSDPVTKLPPKPEEWDVADALKVWFESTTEDDREEFARKLCDGDLHDLLVTACGRTFYGIDYADWLYSVGFFEDTRYVRLPDGVKLNELDEWLRSRYGKGLDEDDESKWDDRRPAPEIAP